MIGGLVNGILLALRAIQRNVEDELAEEMLKGHFGSGDHILADVDPDDPERLKFSKIPSIDPPAASQSEPVHA